MNTKKMLSCLSAVIVATTASAASAATYFAEADFLAVVTVTDTEDWEDETLSGSVGGGGATSLGFDFVTVSTPINAVKVINEVFFGSGNVTPGGANYLYIDTDIGFGGTTPTFTFESAITAFGFFYTGVGRNSDTQTVTVGGNTVAIPANDKGTFGDFVSPLFFGYSGAPISSFTVQMGDNSAFGLDDLVIGSLADGPGTDPEPGVVPLPASSVLLLGGLLGLGAVARRRRR